MQREKHFGIKEVQQECSCRANLPTYICSSCHTLFCSDCANLIGIPSTAVCRNCGSLCFDYQTVLQHQINRAERDSPLGIEDFKSALRFPLRNFSRNLGRALVYGALLYSVPYLGFSGIGLYFGILGVIPALLANCFMIGFNLRVINAVEIGKSENKSILDTIEMLADLGETVALGCGVLLITVVPFLLSFTFALNLAIFRWVTFGWMILYYPLALVVAATTGSFGATINPSNGIREILMYRSGYQKFFTFYLFVCAVTGGIVLTALRATSESLAGSPIVSLLPVFIVLMMFLGSMIFYSNLVVSYLAGRVKFKVST
jgi:hypothetical protein